LAGAGKQGPAGSVSSCLGLRTSRFFEAHTKYLQLAGKAPRTEALLTERLDQHRVRGHQQIIVKHVTVTRTELPESKNLGRRSEAFAKARKGIGVALVSPLLRTFRYEDGAVQAILKGKTQWADIEDVIMSLDGVSCMILR
jgi:hypothetical protein